jgi:hypothetical protein
MLHEQLQFQTVTLTRHWYLPPLPQECEQAKASHVPICISVYGHLVGPPEREIGQSQGPYLQGRYSHNLNGIRTAIQVYKR